MMRQNSILESESRIHVKYTNIFRCTVILPAYECAHTVTRSPHVNSIVMNAFHFIIVNGIIEFTISITDFTCCFCC